MYAATLHTAIVAVFKCTSNAPKDTQVARAKRQAGTQGGYDHEDENEGGGLLGGGDDSSVPAWDPDYRSISDRKVVLARPRADTAAGVI
jgi:hypothetical protein